MATSTFDELLTQIKNLFMRFFSRNRGGEESYIDPKIHLEPKYWPEVKEFIDNLEHLIETHTIVDPNVQQINQRIVAYVQDQINTKGSLSNIEQRYDALDTLADRILSNTLSKIVGLKHMESTHADFSDTVQHFKKRLHERHDAELVGKQIGH